MLACVSNPSEPMAEWEVEKTLQLGEPASLP